MSTLLWCIGAFVAGILVGAVAIAFELTRGYDEDDDLWRDHRP